MKFYIIVSVVAFIPECCSTETTKEPTKEEKPAPNVKETKPAALPESWDSNTNFFWTYKPASQVQNADQSLIDSEFGVHRVVVKQPHSVTRVAKTLSYGFDPQFLKDYFEPFERRPKPVTLVGLRKNGFFPRLNINIAPTSSSEVAELQSPYNDISSFWFDEPANP